MSIRACLPRAIVAAVALATSSALGGTHSNPAPVPIQPVTYQGQLRQNGGPLNGMADIQFGLFASLSGGATLASVGIDAVEVANGLFTVELPLDAGLFDGTGRWLEIAVRSPAGGGAFTTLSPRLPITWTPTALHAQQAEVAYTLGSPDGAQPDAVFVAGSGNVGVHTVVPAGTLSLGDYLGGTVGSVVGAYAKQRVLTGPYNIGTNSGTAVKLLIADYDNENPSDIYPVYVEDENNVVDFCLHTQGALGGSAARTAYFGGNVGLGTTAPLARLDVQGGADSSGANDPHALAFGWRDGGYRHWLRTRHDAAASVGNAIDFYTNTSSDPNGSSAPGTGSVHSLTLANGKVGVGTTSPTSPLQVEGGNAFVATYSHSAGTDPNQQYFAIWGQSDGPRGTAVFGANAATTGPATGIQGNTSSTSGYGAAGAALASSGVDYGVIGLSNSPAGTRSMPAAVSLPAVRRASRLTTRSILPTSS